MPSTVNREPSLAELDSDAVYFSHSDAVYFSHSPQEGAGPELLRGTERHLTVEVAVVLTARNQKGIFPGKLA